ncbi:MAG TPA: GatB/YqeY domain-containing protein [Longimicrobiales bacterium]|nr:GatB/YqeY domain-containing protein [Longimicrobiales bacterium]
MAGTLKDRLRVDLNDARKARDRLRTGVLTMTLSEARNREIELGRELEDPDVVDVVAKAVKRRREAADQMRGAGRPELAEKEEREAEILGAYTPASMDEGEVRAIVRDAIAAGADNMGAVMGAIMPRIRGRFEGREANRIVREELG